MTASSTFIVDISKLSHPDDVKKDFFGKWNHSGSHPVPFLAQFTPEGDVEVERCAAGASGKDVYYLRRLHSIHPSNSQFRRLLAIVSGMILHKYSCSPCQWKVLIVKVDIVFLHNFLAGWYLKQPMRQSVNVN